MRLLIDIGNSRIKWACWDENCLQEMRSVVYEHQDIATCLDQHWRTMDQPEFVNVSCVVDETIKSALEEWIKKQWEIVTEFASVEKNALGITNSYNQYKQLGIDRWLAMIAAHHLSGSAVCVIDCGTAMTIDVVDAEGIHTGGFILPGYSLMQLSLNSASGFLRGNAENIESVVLLPARSTQAGIAAGCKLATIGAIEMLDKIHQEQPDKMEYFMTGGNAALLAPDLSFSVRIEPKLVLLGLAIYAGVRL